MAKVLVIGASRGVGLETVKHCSRQAILCALLRAQHATLQLRMRG